MIKIDNIEFSKAVVDRLKRNFKIVDGENAGRLMIVLKMDRDVQGTFYNYTMTIDSSFMTKAEYDELYDTLSAPVDSHIVEMPFGQEFITFEAYVTTGDDDLTLIKNGVNYWEGLTFSFVATEPQRRPA